jgi:hypothetical protein
VLWRNAKTKQEQGRKRASKDAKPAFTLLFFLLSTATAFWWRGGGRWTCGPVNGGQGSGQRSTCTAFRPLFAVVFDLRFVFLWSSPFQTAKQKKEKVSSSSGVMFGGECLSCGGITDTGTLLVLFFLSYCALPSLQGRGAYRLPEKLFSCTRVNSTVSFFSVLPFFFSDCGVVLRRRYVPVCVCLCRYGHLVLLMSPLPNSQYTHTHTHIHKQAKKPGQWVVGTVRVAARAADRRCA